MKALGLPNVLREDHAPEIQTGKELFLEANIIKKYDDIKGKGY